MRLANFVRLVTLPLEAVARPELMRMAMLLAV